MMIEKIRKEESDLRATMEAETHSRRRLSLHGMPLLPHSNLMELGNGRVWTRTARRGSV